MLPRNVGDLCRPVRDGPGLVIIRLSMLVSKGDLTLADVGMQLMRLKLPCKRCIISGTWELNMMILTNE